MGLVMPPGASCRLVVGRADGASKGGSGFSVTGSRGGGPLGGEDILGGCDCRDCRVRAGLIGARCACCVGSAGSTTGRLATAELFRLRRVLVVGIGAVAGGIDCGSVNKPSFAGVLVVGESVEVRREAGRRMVRSLPRSPLADDCESGADSSASADVEG